MTQIAVLSCRTYESAHRYDTMITTASILVKTAVRVTLGTLQYACMRLVPTAITERTRLILLHLVWPCVFPAMPPPPPELLVVLVGPPVQ